MTQDTDVPMQTPQPKSGDEPSTTTLPGGPDTPSQPESTPATPPSSPSPEWRAGDDAPPWARGKTSEEVLNIASQMYGTLEKFNQTGNVGNAPPVQNNVQQVPNPQAAPQPVAVPQPVELSGEDYVTGSQVQAWAADKMAQIQRANQAQLGGYAQQMASLAKGQVRERHRDVFDKYGPEIEMELSRLPFEQQTVDNLELVVNLVKGKHVDELVEAALRERGAVNAEPNLRSTGGETATTDATPRAETMSDERVPESWRKRAEAVGITEDKVTEWCTLQGISREQFYKDFQRDAITAPEA